MNKVSLICAKPSSQNPGMLTVDLAFENLCRRNGLDFTLRKYCIEEDTELQVPLGHDETMSYHPIEPNLKEIEHSDLILFWGDFLHAWSYHRHDVLARLIEKNKLTTQAQANQLMEKITRLFFLEDFPEEAFKKVISFGTTLVSDDNLILDTQSQYAQRLSAFLGKVDHIWMRDPYSALQVAHLKGTYDKSYLGVDCSLFLRGDEIRALVDSQNTVLENTYDRNDILVHFGRSNINHLILLEFVQAMATQLDRKCQWIPWLNAREDYLAKASKIIPSLKYSPEPEDYFRLLKRLAGATLVITDTYHLSLVALNLGIPTVCVGLGAQHPFLTVSDKKKEIFHYMYNASPCYVFAENLLNNDARIKEAKRVSGVLTSSNSSKLTTAKIHAHTQAVESQLTTCIKDILQSA